MPISFYAKSAGLILLVLVLVVEGYLTYRYYDKYHFGPPAEAAGSKTAGTGDAAPESSDERPEGRREEHRAADPNILGNSTYLDVPGSAGDSGAMLLVEEARGPDGGAYDEHEIGVWYDPGRGGRWAIFNQDRQPMPAGSTFDVVLLTGPDRLVHRSDPNNTAADATVIDDPLTNGKPAAELDVTQNWNPNYTGGVYNDHPVGARYDAAAGRWEIFNEDGAPMPDGAAFNVAVTGTFS